MSSVSSVHTLIDCLERQSEAFGEGAQLELVQALHSELLSEVDELFSDRREGEAASAAEEWQARVFLSRIELGLSICEDEDSRSDVLRLLREGVNSVITHQGSDTSADVVLRWFQRTSASLDVRAIEAARESSALSTLPLPSGNHMQLSIVSALMSYIYSRLERIAAPQDQDAQALYPEEVASILDIASSAARLLDALRDACLTSESGRTAFREAIRRRVSENIRNLRGQEARAVIDAACRLVSDEVQ